MVKTDKEIGEGLPFEINRTADSVILESHGLSYDDVEDMMEDYIVQFNQHIKNATGTALSEMEKGKSTRTAAFHRGYETSKGVKDIFLFMYIENIGDEKIEGSIIKVEIVEQGVVPDSYLDFMNFLKTKA